MRVYYRKSSEDRRSASSPVTNVHNSHETCILFVRAALKRNGSGSVHATNRIRGSRLALEWDEWFGRARVGVAFL